MRTNRALIIGLPLLQVVVALLLIQLGYQQEWRLQRDADVGYAAPAWHLCDAITAPLRPLITSYRLVPLGRHPHLITLMAVALWWFWVAMNIVRWKSRKGLALPSPAPLRLTADVLLVLDGVLCCYRALFGASENGIIWFLQNKFWQESFQTPLEWTMDVTASICYLLWSVVLIVVFGHDILRAPSRSRKHQGVAAG